MANSNFMIKFFAFLSIAIWNVYAVYSLVNARKMLQTNKGKTKIKKRFLWQIFTSLGVLTIVWIGAILLMEILSR